MLNRRGLKRQNLRFRVMRNLHKILGDIFGGILERGGRKFWKKFSISRGRYYDTPPRVSCIMDQKIVIFHYFRSFFNLLYTELMKSGTMVKKWKVGQKNG